MERVELAIRLLRAIASWKTLILGVVLFAATQVFLAGYVIPQIESRRPEAVKDGRLVMMDFQQLASADEQYRVIDLYKSDIVDYVRMLYAADYVIPFSFTLLFLALFGILQRFADRTGRWRWVMLIPLMTLLFDWSENTLALFLIGEYPQQVHRTLAGVEGYITFLKLATSAINFIVLALLIVLALITYVRKRSQLAANQ